MQSRRMGVGGRDCGKQVKDLSEPSSGNKFSERGAVPGRGCSRCAGAEGCGSCRTRARGCARAQGQDGCPVRPAASARSADHGRRVSLDHQPQRGRSSPAGTPSPGSARLPLTTSVPHDLPSEPAKADAVGRAGAATGHQAPTASLMNAGWIAAIQARATTASPKLEGRIQVDDACLSARQRSGGRRGGGRRRRVRGGGRTTAERGPRRFTDAYRPPSLAGS